MPKIELNYQISGKTVDVLLKNQSKSEINLGGFGLKFGSQKYRFAKDTIISTNSILKLSGALTRFEFSLKNLKKTEISLNYPNEKNLQKIDFQLDPIKNKNLILDLIKDLEK